MSNALFSIQSNAEITTIQEIDLVTIPEGHFDMGDGGENSPVHPVSLNSFLMSVTEITQSQYKSITGSNPSVLTIYGSNPLKITRDDVPVGNVSWFEHVE